MAAALVPLAEIDPRPRRLALGTFDGVHLGHREVIEGADTVVTFWPHPVSVVHPARAPLLITTLERKAELVAQHGVAEVVVAAFDRAVSDQPAADWIDEVLVGRLRATHVSVGENFRFGAAAAGGAELLRDDPRFETRVAPLLELDGEIVSSSHIRGLLLGGAVEYAGTLLGEPFVMDGRVAHGDARGRTLDFPTANLLPQDGYITPGHGVYACTVRTADGAEHLAATNVGVRPQFVTGRGVLVEAHLLDFDEDLYGQPLRVRFHKRLRGERRFDSVDALVEQMHSDVAQTRSLLS